jgi:hypothetical protein
MLCHRSHASPGGALSPERPCGLAVGLCGLSGAMFFQPGVFHENHAKPKEKVNLCTRVTSICAAHDLAQREHHPGHV